MHQAAITNSTVGIFVIAQVGGYEGCIVQIAIVGIPHGKRIEYISKMTSIGESLLGWFYNDEVAEKDYLDVYDIPSWIKGNILDAMKPRAQLTYGHYNLICKDVEYKPTPPFQLYKHHVQLCYNQGKPGLDKNTEIGLRVYHSQPTSFETKYVLTLLDRVLVNEWRAETAATVIKSWIFSWQQRCGVLPLFAQIMKKVENSITIDDYVDTFAIVYLVLQKQVGNKSSIRINPEVSELNILRGNEIDILLTRQDQKILSILHKFKQKKQ